MLSSFKDTVDSMTVEQKRAAIRTFLKQVIWDGSKVHLVVFGSNYEYDEISVDMGDVASKDGENASFKMVAEKENVRTLCEDSK